jgi:hypothetical protein
MADNLWRMAADGAYLRPSGQTFERPGGKPLKGRTPADYAAAKPVSSIPCESIRGQWGGICPACHQRLPNPGPLRSWVAEKHLGPII